MSIWGLKVTQANPLNLEELDRPLIVSRASLASGNTATLSITFDGNTYVQGSLTKSGKSSFFLGSLIASPCSFSVAGDGEVHLTGSYADIDESIDSDDISSDGEDAELLAQRREETEKATKLNLQSSLKEEGSGKKAKKNPNTQNKQQNQNQNQQNQNQQSNQNKRKGAPQEGQQGAQQQAKKKRKK